LVSFSTLVCLPKTAVTNNAFPAFPFCAHLKEWCGRVKASVLGQSLRVFDDASPASQYLTPKKNYEEKMVAQPDRQQLSGSVNHCRVDNE